ncbi:MAG TPA: PH domain-containing protein [Sphingomicrobium sp.]|jgi:membrane protein YdbS with pleckstrin-like domain|nr:PH domain-containing protein [Sphingomicrobium sp.]
MADAPELHPVETGYKNVLRIRLGLAWLLLTIIATVPASALSETSAAAWLLPLVVLAIGLAVVAIAPQRIYRRLRYGLTDRLLQVVRGWLFHTDTVVPLVRVQHIDVVRGPFDKMFGTSSLVVHTAGTHNSIVTVRGLAPERAAAMRDVIREHVRTDFA